MKNKNLFYLTGIHLKKIWLLISFLGMLVSVWPSADSLTSLTGEVDRQGQLLGTLQWFLAAIRPQPQLSAETPVSPTIKGRGMNIFAQHEPSLEVRERIFAELQRGGFTFARQQFAWQDIEIHGKGDFVDRRNVPEGISAWEKYDHIVQSAENHQVALIARLDAPPAWSRADGEARGPFGPPDDYGDYADFVQAVATRYRGRISYYQIWNEPNGNGEWGLVVNPEQFTQLLCLAYQRIKSADPDALILAPALSPTVSLTAENLNDLLFLQRMYNAGATDCFDIMSVQAYGLNSGPADQRLLWNKINVTYHLYTRDVMVKNGDGHKPLWISEAGWNAIPDGIVPKGSEPFGQVTEAQKAAYGVGFYQRVGREWPWIGVANYWFLKRHIPEPDQPSYYFRAMEPDFTPLPVWDSLSQRSDDPAPLAQPRPNTAYRPILFSLSLALFFPLLLSFGRPTRPERP